MSAPLVVNTVDGTVWRLRPQQLRDGLPLYAIEGAPEGCPEFVMATYAELEAHGIAGSAYALPMPSGSEPRTLDVVEEELTGANLSLYEEELENKRLFLAWGSARMRARRKNEALKKLRARVAELKAERHSTNEALNDAVQALREQQERFETLRALCDAADQVGIVSGGWFTVEAVRRAVAGEPLPKPDGITQRIAPTQALRALPGVSPLPESVREQVAEVLDPNGEFYRFLHHENRTPHDLPETGGAR